MKKLFSLAAILFVTLSIVLLNTSSIASYMEEDGFVMPGTSITDMMMDRTSISGKQIDLVKVDHEAMILEKRSGFYDEKGKELDFDFPIIIRENTALKFMQNNAYLISDQFDYLPVIENMTVVDQSSFNDDGSQADLYSYILAQLGNGLYESTIDFTITTRLASYHIPKHSIFHFDEEFVNAYVYDNGVYKFQAIRGLQDATIEYGKTNIKYSEFYKSLFNVKEEIKKLTPKPEEVIKEKIKENKQPSKPIDKNQVPTPPVDDDKEVIVPEDPGEPIPPKYVKPTVEIGKLSAWVYSVDGTIKINDPSGRINRGVVVNVYNENGSLLLRQQVNQSGLMHIVTLPPDTTLYVAAYFQYYDEKGKLVKENVIEGVVLKTLPIANNVSPVDLNFQKSKISNGNQMSVEQMTLKNTSDYDKTIETLENFYKNTLPYVYQMTFTFRDEAGNDIKIDVNNTTLVRLKKGESLSYATSKKLKSNTKYQYSVIIYDRFGNELPFKEKVEGTYSTCKSTPSVNAKVTSNAMYNFEFQLTIDDEDKALDKDNYIVQIFDGDVPLELEYSFGNSSGTATEIPIPNATSITQLKIKNLPLERSLTLYAYGSYDLADGQSIQERKEIGKLVFYSSGIPSGSISYNNSFTNVGGSFATINVDMAQTSTVALVNLLSEFDVTIQTTGQKLTTNISKEALNKVNIEQNYNQVKEALKIQTGNKVNKTPTIWIKASKETLLKQGAWQTLINSALLGKHNDASGTLHIEYLQGTLLSSSKYTYTMESIADLGIRVFDVDNFWSENNFTTLNSDAVVHYDDFFLAQEFIELYDVRVQDLDKTIGKDTYVIELLEDGKLINSKSLSSTQTYEKVRFDALQVDKKYTLRFVAPTYYSTKDHKEFIQNYLLREENFLQKEGLQANIQVDSMASSYNSSLFTNAYVKDKGKGVTLNTSYDLTSRSVVEKKGSFITDYLEYTPKQYSFFKNFGATTQDLIIIGYNENHVFEDGFTSHNGAYMFSMDAYNGNWIYNNPKIKYIRLVGIMGNEDIAQYTQFNSDHLNELANVTKNPDQFIDGVLNGTGGSDSISTNTSSTDFIKCTQGELLFVQSNLNKMVFFYDEGKDFISSKYGGYNVIEIPSKAKYMRIRVTDLNKQKDIVNYYTIKGSENQSFIGTVKWNMSDTKDDSFFVNNENNHIDTYKISKYSTKDVVNMGFDKTEYTRNSKLTYDRDGNVAIHNYTQERFASQQGYRYEIAVEYHGREVVLDSTQFKTDRNIHILSSGYDVQMLSYDPSGYFIAVNDIEEIDGKSITDVLFTGELDFQGYSFFQTVNSPNSIIADTLGDAIIKNLRFVSRAETNRPFIINNRGVIDNVIYVIEDSAEDDVRKIQPAFVGTNSRTGVISNFIVQLNGNVHLFRNDKSAVKGLLTNYNHGIIENGYLFNTDPKGKAYVFNSGGLISGMNFSAGTIRNVYAVSNIYANYDASTSGTIYASGVICGKNNTGKVQDVFGVSTRYNYLFDESTLQFTDLQASNYDDPLFGATSTSNSNQGFYKNVYLSSAHKEYQKLFSQYFDIRNLHDVEWYDHNIASQGMFQIDPLVNVGYYPILSMNESMMKYQVYTSLPEKQELQIPEIRDVQVKKQNLESAEVILKFNNPSNVNISEIEVGYLKPTILQQGPMKDYYEVKILVSNPEVFVNGYTLKSFTYQQGTSTPRRIQTDIPVDVEFYSPIKNLEDWKNIRNKPNYNYRLMNDLDFSVVDITNWKNMVYLPTFNGKLDGGRYNVDGDLVGNYEMKNLDLENASTGTNGILMDTLTNAEIKNINFSNIRWEKLNNNSNGALFYSSQFTTFDNIHIKDVVMSSRSTITTLVTNTYYSIIQNCSVNNAKLRNTSDTTNGVYIGGLVTILDNTTIRNSYVAGLDIKTNNVDISKSVGVGGIAGRSNNTSRIENCYATGTIQNTSYNGGIVGIGTPKVSQVYSNVKIEADGDYNGGIVGSNEVSDIIDSLSIGDFIIALKDINYSNRITATPNYYSHRNNFAYDGQLLNNTTFGLSDAMKLLTYEDLCMESTYRNKIGLGNAYDYNSIKNGSLPKLKDTHGNLLPNQSNSYLVSNEIGLTVDEALYDGVSNYTTYISVNHRGYSVDEITIDGMDLSKQPELIGSEAGWSRYRLVSTKNQALDIYRVRAKLINKNDAKNKIEIVATVDYGDPVYWEIETATQWQSIMKTRYNTNENIKIVGEIDFTGIKDPIIGVKVNRLEGIDEKTSVIKGLGFTDASSSKNFISSVLTETKNLSFKDITFDLKTYSGSQTGVYGKIQGKASNLTFETIRMNIEKITSSYIGMIASISGPLRDVTLSDIKIAGKSTSYRDICAGGLAGYTGSSVINVKANNIDVNIVNGNYVGGLIGRVTRSDTGLVEINGVSIKNSQVKGHNSIGGAFGEVNSNGLPIYNISATKMTIDTSVDLPLEATSNNDVGGLIGRAYLPSGVVDNKDLDGYTISDSTIKGQYNVGGVVGSINDYGKLIQLNVNNINVESKKVAGGIAGVARNVEINNCIASNSTIIAEDKIAGGISGAANRVTNSQSIGVSVKAPQYAGGIAGIASYYVSITTDICLNRYGLHVYDNAVLDSSIEVSDMYVGGIAGYEHGGGGGIYRSVVKGTKISSENGYAGGLVGKLHSSNLYQSYIDGGSIVSNGDYTGGIVGYAKLDTKDDSTIYPSHLYRCYSNTTITGRDYTGGVIGYYDTIQDSASDSNRYLFALTSYSNVTGNDHTYAIGFVEPSSVNKVNQAKYGSFDAKDTSKVNGVEVGSSNLSNIKDPSKYRILTKDQLTDYTYLTGLIANGGMAQDLNTTNSLVTTASELEAFAITPKKIIDNNEYNFLLNGINLNDGNYLIKVGSNQGKPIYKNDTNKDGFDEVSIQGGSLDYSFGTESHYSVKDFSIIIYDVQSKKEYGKAWIGGISSSYNILPMLVDEKPSVYKSTDKNEAITLRVDDNSGDAYRWFRVHQAQGYSSNVIEVTAFAKGNSLTTNVAGVYYAYATNNTNKRSQIMTYDGLLYLPQTSSLATGGNVAFQNGYTIQPNGKIVENYEKDMNFKEATSIGKATKKAMLNTQQINKSATLPEFKVYSSGIDTINIEFDESVPYQEVKSNMQLNVSTGDDKASFAVKGRVLSLQYDYQDDIKVEVSNGVETSEKVVFTDELRKTVSTYGKEYYYLTSKGAIKDDGILEGDFIHLYEDKVLDSAGAVYDVETKEIVNELSQTLDEREVKPLYSSEHEGNDLLAFQGFTYNTNTLATQELIMYAKDSQFLVVDGELDKQGTSFIADQYDENSYLAYLSTKGSIAQLRNEMKMPDEFKNKRIVEMNDNYQSDSDIVMARYDNGTFAAFHYLTGEMITLSNQDEPSLFEYAKMMFDDLWIPEAIDSADAYQQSQGLQGELAALSMEQWMELYEAAALKGDSDVLGEIDTSTSPTLISVFNATTKEYDIYNTEKLLSSTKEVVSETEIIEAGGESDTTNAIHNMVATRKKVTTKMNANGILLFGTIACSLVALLWVLRNKEKIQKRVQGN